MVRPSGASALTSRAQSAMNSSAFGSRSRSRNGVGSSELKSCCSSERWTSIRTHPGGNPADDVISERIPRGTALAHKRSMSAVIAAIDLGPSSPRVLYHAGGFAKLWSTRLHIMHVTGSPREGDRQRVLDYCVQNGPYEI